MYGEPARIRQVAERLERRADDLRRQAGELLARSESVGWASAAADRMRVEARERHDELRRVAAGYDEAAQRVREHADRVQELLDLIASIEQQARRIIDGAVDAVRSAVDAVVGGIKDAFTDGDREAERIANTPCPPPGHKDWLDMPELIPGIRL